jgi:hypothetical protein
MKITLLRLRHRATLYDTTNVKEVHATYILTVEPENGSSTFRETLALTQQSTI